MTNKERMASLMAEPVRNLVHSFYDGFVEANATYKLNSGVQAVIVRRQIGKCCDWCANLCGVFEYGDHPEDIFRRHDSCKCQVTYSCEKGVYKDVHSKREYRSQREARINRMKEIQTLENTDNHGKIEKRRKAEDNAVGYEAAKRRLRLLIQDETLDEIKNKLVKSILNGEISLTQKKQKYLHHVLDTQQYKNATRDRNRVQSYLLVSEEEAQDIIFSKCGKGVCVFKGDHLVEFIDLGYKVGRYNDGHKWHDTERVMIDYAKKGSHIVPVKPL